MEAKTQHKLLQDISQPLPEALSTLKQDINAYKNCFWNLTNSFCH